MNDDYCVVDWVFDETTVAPDAAYADGYVTNGFYGTDIEVWHGFVILSRPTTRESCDEFNIRLVTHLGSN